MCTPHFYLILHLEQQKGPDMKNKSRPLPHLKGSYQNLSHINMHPNVGPGFTNTTKTLVHITIHHCPFWTTSMVKKSSPTAAGFPAPAFTSSQSKLT